MLIQGFPRVSSDSFSRDPSFHPVLVSFSSCFQPGISGDSLEFRARSDAQIVCRVGVREEKHASQRLALLFSNALKIGMFDIGNICKFMSL